MDAPLTYEGINDLYLSCPAESQICNFKEISLKLIFLE